MFKRDLTLIENINESKPGMHIKISQNVSRMDINGNCKNNCENRSKPFLYSRKGKSVCFYIQATHLHFPYPRSSSERKEKVIKKEEENSKKKVKKVIIIIKKNTNFTRTKISKFRLSLSIRICARLSYTCQGHQGDSALDQNSSVPFI